MSTVEKAADGAEDKVKAELHIWSPMRAAPHHTGTKVAAVLREFSSSMGTIMLDSAAGTGAARTERASLKLPAAFSLEWPTRCGIKANTRKNDSSASTAP